MISSALTTWRGTRAARLDRLVQTRLIIGRSALWAADELDQALVLRVASEFQGFARELHDDAVSLIAEAVAPGDRRRQLLLALPYQAARRLDRGNADTRALNQDFNLFGLALWSDLEQCNPGRVAGWKIVLETLNTAQTFIPEGVGPCQATSGGLIFLFLVLRRLRGAPDRGGGVKDRLEADRVAAGGP